jgi:hypothetical protein
VKSDTGSRVKVDVLMMMGSVTIRLTGMVWGVFEAPDALTVKAPVYVPAARDEVAKDMVTESCSPVDVPFDGLQVNQAVFP